MFDLRTAAIAAAFCVLAGGAVAGDSLKQDRETVVLPDDQLAVTVDKAAPSETSDYALWVGEVEIAGRKTLWVELIDDHGEVIYDSEVSANETHLVPDGRALVVRALSDDGSTRIAKQDESRVAPDARLVVTRRVVDDSANQASIEFIEEKPETPRSTLLEIAEFGQSVWSAIVGAFSAAADSVKVAWHWLFGSANA